MKIRQLHSQTLIQYCRMDWIWIQERKIDFQAREAMYIQFFQINFWSILF